MKLFFVVAALVVAAAAFDANELNSMNLGWTAGSNYMTGKSPESISRMLGYKRNDALWESAPWKEADVADVPATFFSAANWNYSIISDVHNQGECGSCWAFGAVETAESRQAIATQGKLDMRLSEQELTSCGPDAGCEGGDAMSAQAWIHENGLVSNECYPYTEPTCAPSQQPCEPPFQPTNPCHQPNSTCTTYQFGSPYRVGSIFGNKVESMKKELVANGPFEVCFTVYQSFVHYKKGVWKKAPGDKALGGHCVNLQGYGSQDGEDYWLIKNSWTTAWSDVNAVGQVTPGNGGYFKIIMGDSSLNGGIEEDAVALMPKA